MKISDKGAICLLFSGRFREYPEKKSSHFFVSTKKISEQPSEAVSKNTAIQGFLLNLPFLRKLQKQTIILNFLHTITAPLWLITITKK